MKIFMMIILAFVSLHAVTISTNKATYDSAEVITITLADVTGNNNNWVGIFQKGVPNEWNYDLQDKWFDFHDGTLTLTAPDLSGEYEVRLFYNDSLTMEKKVAFTVHGADATITLDKATYSAGEPISVTLANVQGAKDNWVGIFQKNATSNWNTLLSENWFDFSNGTLHMNAPDVPGDYEVRLFYNDSLLMAKKASFKIETLPVTLSTDKAQYNDGDTITVSYTNITGAQSNWIGLFAKDMPSNWDNAIQEAWLENRNGTVTFTAPDFPQDYEIRLFYNDSFNLEKKTTLNVKKIIKPRAPTIYEDAEDGKTLGWFTTGGPDVVQNIKVVGSRSIWGNARWDGDHYPRQNHSSYKKVLDNGELFNNTDQFILALDTIGPTGCMRFGVEVRTKQGFRAITLSTWFDTNNYPPQKQIYSDGYVELTYPIPMPLRYYGRHSVQYNLQTLLHQLEPDNDIISVDAFYMSGYSEGAGGVDNVRLLSQ